MIFEDDDGGEDGDDVHSYYLYCVDGVMKMGIVYCHDDDADDDDGNDEESHLIDLSLNLLQLSHL